MEGKQAGVQIFFSVVLAASLAVFYMGKGGAIAKAWNTFVYGKPGCAPLPFVNNLSVHYFAGRGRGEPIFMMLEETGTKYEVAQYTKETWPQEKKRGIESGLFAFGQLPVIETGDGMRMAQSQAILHYIGRTTGLECDCEDLHMCEMISQGVEDVNAKYGKLLYNPEFKLYDREEYLTKTLPDWLAFFEKLAPPLAKQQNAFFSSDRLTWVDFAVFDMLDKNQNLGFYNFGPSIGTVEVLANFPKLNSFYKFFAGRPNIAKYLTSEKRFPYKIPYQPKEFA